MSEDLALEEPVKHVAILGGSFDPPTIAHIQTASEIYNLVGKIDEVWLVPCGDNRKDKALKASARQRKEMLELAIKDILDEKFPNIKVCDFEIEYGSYLPTYDLLCKLKEKYPLNKFYMSIGSDLVEGLQKWDKGELLLRENEFIVICREVYNLDKLNLSSNFTKLDCNIYGSSTSIRNRIGRLNKTEKTFNIQGLTTKSILRFIQKHNLYY